MVNETESSILQGAGSTGFVAMLFVVLITWDHTHRLWLTIGCGMVAWIVVFYIISFVGLAWYDYRKRTKTTG